MKSPKNIIKELQKLIGKEAIDVSSFFDPTEEFKYESIKHYINTLKNRTKPETASSELFRDIIKDVLNRQYFSEVNIGTGFIDFALKESGGNPILFELKPLFKFIPNKEVLKPERLDFTQHQDQILKYLKRNEYVILTNLKDAYLFSRNAIIDFEPFSTLQFTDLLSQFLEYGTLWDTIRRIEDQEVKVDLDKTFFEDLTNWYEEFKKIKIIENERFSKEELIVLLLNKVIFIKTLEDFGLIQFKHLTDEYYNKKDKWEAKGSERILTTFFKEMEEYFDYFYDTELFKVKFWDYVDKEKTNMDKFQNIFETALGLDAWNKAFGRGMIHYNYRWIDEDIFGKAYETFIAENKKDTGVYYTPKEITQYMASKLVKYLFEPIISEIIKSLNKDNPDYKKANELLTQLYKIKIIDPSSGSGSFLIKVLREIYNYYKKIDDATGWVISISGVDLFDLPSSFKATKDFREEHNFNDHLQLISKIILRHIYAADIDERALETAKTNIWKEAIKLNPKIYNYKKLNSKSSHILPDLELNFIAADSLADLHIEEQIKLLTENYKTEIKKLYELRKDYISDPFNPEVVDEALKIREKIYYELKIKLPEIEKPIFCCLQYFYSFFNEEGIPLKKEDRGFHGVISNPPWETIKPFEKEFAKIAKGKLDILEFKKWFNTELEKNNEFANRWEEYKEFYKTYNSIISERYLYQGIGDPNYYKYFIERDLELLKSNGQLSILVPSGIQTDMGSSELRHLITSDYLLTEIASFENRGYKTLLNGNEKSIKLFPEVDSRFKFTALRINKTPSHPFMSIEGKFYLHNPDELYKKEPIDYTINMIEKFSPENLSIMEFRDNKDYEICLKIRNDFKLLGELSFQFTSEFHMTNDSFLFTKVTEKKKMNNEFFPLYEGKMIHQYNSSFDKPRYLIDKNNATDNLLKTKETKIKRYFNLSEQDIKKLNINLDFEEYRLAYRAIGRSTDERTIISSIVPANVFLGNSLNYLINYFYELENEKIEQKEISSSDKIILMCLLNSLTLNYYIRNKISANLNMFFMYELPIPEITEGQKDYLVNAGINLLCLKNDPDIYKDLRSKLKIRMNRKLDPIKLRAELEIFIAKGIYKLNKDDWKYITSTFTFGGKSITRKELDKIIEVSNELYS